MQLDIHLVLNLPQNYFSEDAEKLRMHTSSEAGDMESLEKMIDGSDSEDTSEGSSADLRQ